MADKKIFIGKEKVGQTEDTVWFGTHAKAIKVNSVGNAPISLYATLIRGVSYSSQNHIISFLNEESTPIFTLDAAPFIIDGMVDDVRIEDGYLIIDFNTASGKQDISIPLTDIFDPNNYYNKTQTDGLLAQKQGVIQDLAAIRSGASAGATAVQPAVMNAALENVPESVPSTSPTDLSGNVEDVYLKNRSNNNPQAPRTLARLVTDSAKNRPLNESLTRLAEYQSLGFPAFSTSVDYAEGDPCFHDRRLYKAKAGGHSAGTWNAAHFEEFSVKEYTDAHVGIFDVSANNGGAVFASLQALLNDANLNTLIPAPFRRGGITITFIHGENAQSSDNKYVQYRLMNTSFSTDEADWQGVDDEIIPGSKNLTESNAVYKGLLPLKQLTDLTKNWGYKFTLGGTSNGIVTLKTPVVLSHNGDSFEVVVSSSTSTALNFSNSGLAGHAYALAFNKTYIGLRDATGVDGNWLVVNYAHRQSPVDGKFIVKIEYADSKIYLYVNNTLVYTVNSQSLVQIGSFGNGGAGTYGYWSGDIYSMKWNGNDIDLMNDSVISEGVDISMTDSILLAIDNEGYPKGFLHYHDEIFYFYSRYEKTPYYVRYTIQKSNATDDLVYSVYWELKKAKLFKFTADGFVDLNKELIDDAESEFVIHEKGKSDFTGGYHGDERIDIDPSSFVRFFADGKVVSPNDNGGSDFTMECEEFCYMESSSMHETSDVAGEYVPGHPIIAYHFKKNTFNNGGYHVENMIQFTGEHIITVLFAGICCVDKDAATSVYLPDNILLENLNGSNDFYDASDIHATKVEMWNPSNKLRVTVDSHFIEGITDDETGRPLYIWDRGVDTKYYHALETQKAFNEGETVRAEMKVEFFIGEQTN